MSNHDPDLNQQLADAYNDTKHGLCSAKSLWERVRQTIPMPTVPRGFKYEPSLQYVKNWLVNQAAHSTHTAQQVKHYYPITNNRYAPFQRVQMDIMFPGGQSDKPVVMKDPINDKDKTCILVFVDTVTRYLLAYPMNSKSGDEVTRTFANGFLNDIDKLNQMPPVEIDCDSEPSFMAPLKHWCSSHGYMIEFKSNSLGDHRKDQLALAFIDRAIRTLRTLLDKYQIQYDTTDWVQALPALVDGYNNTPHAGTGVSPVAMLKGSFNENEDWEKGQFNDTNRVHSLVEKASEEPWSKRDIEVGDRVRIPVETGKFYKRSKQRWQTHPYTVKAIEDGVYYKLDGGTKGMRSKYKKYELLPVRLSLHSDQAAPFGLYYGSRSANEGGQRRKRELDQIAQAARKR